MKRLSLPNGSPMLDSSFVYGVATASFQIEGGIEQRLPNIWDTFCAQENKIADHSDGSVACNHYELWQQDIDMIESLGVDAYRLSISWPRVVTKEGQLNPVGINFYKGILERLKQKNIKAFVTLYHWDLPQYLEDKGGWLNRETAIAFAHYADLVSNELGDLVDSYATLNEPFCSAYLGYEVGIHAPGLTGKQYGKKAAHHLLLAHGMAMRVLKQNVPNAMCGIVLNFTPCYAKTDNEADVYAARYADDYFNQWYIRPVMDGKYPDIIESLPASDQPDIHPTDMEIISTPLDFLGINFYTRMVYQANDTEIFEELAPQAPLTDIGWEIYPQAFYELLTSLNDTYQLPPVYITENGAAMADVVEQGEVNDEDRIDYYQAHLTEVHRAIKDGVDVRGYFAWSLMDNFEWAEGYSKRFGIVYVDYGTQKRTIKASGLAYQALITNRT